MTATIAAAARSVAAPATRDRRRHLVDGPGLDRGLLRRGAGGAGPAGRDRQGRARGRRRRDHRLLRRHRARRRARDGAHSGDRHLRGGARDRLVRRTALHRGDDDGALARADRSIWSIATAWPAGRACGPPIFRCCRSKIRPPARPRSCAARSPARWTRTAPRRSCSAAPAWPTSPPTLQREFGVPVIDGVAAAVKQAEALVALGLTTSKRGAYASPLAKPYTGALQSFAPDHVAAA